MDDRAALDLALAIVTVARRDADQGCPEALGWLRLIAAAAPPRASRPTASERVLAEARARGWPARPVEPEALARALGVDSRLTTKLLRRDAA